MMKAFILLIWEEIMVIIFNRFIKFSQKCLLNKRRLFNKVNISYFCRLKISINEDYE